MYFATELKKLVYLAELVSLSTAVTVVNRIPSISGADQYCLAIDQGMGEGKVHSGQRPHNLRIVFRCLLMSISIPGKEASFSIYQVTF